MRPQAGFEQPGAFTIARHGVSAEDTLVVLGPMRLNSRRAHPAFIAAGDDEIVFFTEEVDRHRLLAVSCQGEIVREIEIPPLGRSEYFEFRGNGLMRLHPSATPLPSGLLRTEDALLWAVRDVITRGERSDSVTIITRIEDGGRRSSGTVRGWYQLVDHDAGRLLLITGEPVSRVLVVELMSLLDTFVPTAGPGESSGSQ